MRKTLPSGRVFRPEESSVRKSLPYGRLFCKQESSVRKTLLYARAFRAEDCSVRKRLLLWTMLPCGMACGKFLRERNSQLATKVATLWSNQISQIANPKRFGIMESTKSQHLQTEAESKWPNRIGITISTRSTFRALARVKNSFRSSHSVIPNRLNQPDAFKAPTAHSETVNLGLKHV